MSLHGLPKTTMFFPKMTRGRDKKRAGIDLLFLVLEITGPFCFAVLS